MPASAACTLSTENYYCSSRNSSHTLLVTNGVVVSSADSVDIVFVLDDSTTVSSSNFELMKSLLSQLVANLDIESNNTRVGIIAFASHVRISIRLDKYSSHAALRRAISSLKYHGGQNNTAGALKYVRTAMLTPQRGDRSDVPNVIVLLTDGTSDDPAAAQVCRACSEVYCMLLTLYTKTRADKPRYAFV